MYVLWDDAIVVSAGKLRKLWDSLSELRSSVCERRLERTVLWPALLPVRTAQFTQFFPSGITSYSEIAQLNRECIGRLKSIQHVAVPRKHPLRTYLAVSWFSRFDAAVVDKPIMAVKSKETTALLDDIQTSSSAICSKQDYIAYQYVQKQDRQTDRQNSASARPFACHINLTAAILCNSILVFRDVTLHRWISGSRRFEVTCRRLIQPFKMHEEWPEPVRFQKIAKSSIAPLRTAQNKHRPFIFFADMEKISENENRHQQCISKQVIQVLPTDPPIIACCRCKDWRQNVWFI
jgi:hypothetical protein